MGVAASTGGREAPAHLLARADAAMYHAKRRGGGQYFLSGPATSRGLPLLPAEHLRGA